MKIEKETQQFVIGLLGLGMVCFAVIMLFTKPIPGENRDALTVVLGAILGYGGAVMTFFLPGSVGSREKDATINKLVDQQAETK
jgi:hypothetical protein